jgi:hypothetical protein
MTIIYCDACGAKKGVITDSLNQGPCSSTKADLCPSCVNRIAQIVRLHEWTPPICGEGQDRSRANQAQNS